jgi:FeS assembly SUF system protein
MTQAPETLHRKESAADNAVEPKTPRSAKPGVMTDAVIAALRTVRDPEIPVNIFDLGLIYRTDVNDRGAVEIDMTLTAPGCPVAGEILSDVKKAVRGVDGIGEVTVNLVFDPPWDRSMMSEEAKLELGFVEDL